MSQAPPHIIVAMAPDGRVNLTCHGVTALTAGKMLAAAMQGALNNVTEAPPKPQIVTAQQVPDLIAMRAATNGDGRHG